MHSLEKKIDELFHRNNESQRFIPYKSLDLLLNEAEILSALEENETEIFRRDSILSRILSGGKRVFAILVSIDQVKLIYNFIENDNYSTAELDDKLPLSKDNLELIFGRNTIGRELEEERDREKRKILERKLAKIERLARLFEEKQYEYITPSFQRKSTHRMLVDRLILPFKSKKAICEGGFGDVYKVTLPHTADPALKEQQLVLKELKSFKLVNPAFDAEQRCLEILRLIEHPNILEMYCSFTYRSRKNFLFPLAKGGDLQKFVSEDTRPPELKANETVYFALCGLSSALESVHSYTHKSLDLEMIGCHHDLKPKNILIDGDRFILSDFGLSQMKNVTDSSKTMFKSGEGYYLAPECEDLETFERFEVSRPSDIWAFGCILAVTLTYLKQGRAGVEDFQARRRVDVETIYGAPATFWVFHSGRREKNKAVTQWIADAERTGTFAEQKLATLVKDMLNIEPSKRPLIDECSRRLRLVALMAISETIEEAFLKAGGNHRGKLEFEVEEILFKTWVRIMPDVSMGIVQSERAFQDVFSTLTRIQAELEALGNTERSWYSLFIRLKYLNGQLNSNLPKDAQSRIRSLVEFEILRSESHPKQTPPVEPSITVSPGDRLLILSSIKHMSTLVSSSVNKSIQINVEDIKDIDYRSTFFTGRFRPTENKSDEENVIIEHLKYDSSWQGQDGQQLFTRMENVLRLPEKTREFRALQCRGFCHDQIHHRFALIYRFPAGPNDKVTQLIDVIGETATAIFPSKDMPLIVTLQDRFRLAYQLSEAVHEFHKIGWLHKSISSYNVVFFSENTKSIRYLRSPFITGFSHSQPNHPDEISAIETDTDELLSIYQHPRYRNHPTAASQTRYCAEFDYYSLGLVLLEIGYWTPLKHLRGTHSKPAQIEKDLKKLTTYLTGPMGLNYRDAVQACLTEGGLSADGPQRVDTNFEHLVLKKLKVCSV